MVQKSFNRRVLITGILIAVMGIVFIIKIFGLTLLNRTGSSPVLKHDLVRRGYIKDRNGYILALSIPTSSVYVNPEMVSQSEETADTISTQLSLSYDVTLERISRKKKFVWLKRNIPKSTAEAIRNLYIPGVFIKNEYMRVYPHNELASNLIGFTGIDNTGLEGLEYRYDSLLNGDDHGTVMSDIDFRYGSNVNLTIDSNIQFIAEKSLSLGCIESSARSGSVVVIDVKNGEILAVAKYPNYDLNHYRQSTEIERRNFSITDAFEPGSIMKAAMAAAYLMKGNNPNERFSCTGAVQIGDTNINCTGVHGMVDLSEALRYSCNAGIISAMKHMPAKDFYNFLISYHFGDVSGSGIPGEATGSLHPYKSWSGLSKYSIAIGQEIAVTSLQMAAFYSAIANNGIYCKPHIVQSVEDYEGKIIGKQNVSSEQIIDAKHTQLLRSMLKGVIDSGAGKRAALKYYKAAGKTGTAQKYIKSSYGKNINISSFIGFAPVEKADICIAVTIDEPKGVTSGGEIAAPVFGAIADEILAYRGVTDRVARGLNPQKSSLNYEFAGKCPDFKKMELAGALDRIIVIQRSIAVKYSIVGNGKVVGQKPEPFDKLKDGDEIVLILKGDNE